jgi:hypothetical protein
MITEPATSRIETSLMYGRAQIVLYGRAQIGAPS